MAKGWNSIENEWYFLEQNVAMQTGWIENNGNWYYFKSNGPMAKG